MERAPWRGRNRLVSGAAEARAGQPAGHREPLFLGSEPWEMDIHGQSRTWPSSCAVPKASTQPSKDFAVSCHSLAEQKKKKQTKSREMAPAFPSLTAVQSATHPALVSPPAPLPPWAGEGTLGAQNECSGEEMLPVPFSNTPSIHSHVQGAVLCDPLRVE